MASDHPDRPPARCHTRHASRSPTGYGLWHPRTGCRRHRGQRPGSRVKELARLLGCARGDSRPPTVSSDRPHIAAFDVDGTLTTRDCVVPFLRRVAGTRHLAQHLGTDARQTVPALMRRDRNELKARARAGGLRRPTRARSWASRHGLREGQCIRRWLRADTLEMLRSHQAAGDTMCWSLRHSRSTFVRSATCSR